MMQHNTLQFGAWKLTTKDHLRRVRTETGLQLIVYVEVAENKVGGMTGFLVKRRKFDLIASEEP